jgi:molybdate transport system ATP-binding protein
MRSELDDLLQRIDIPMLMITHDKDDLARFGEATLYLRDGLISERPAPSLLRASPSSLHAV